jgi:hypothetical protein
VETQLASACAATAESEPPPKLKEPRVALLDAATLMQTCLLDGSRCFLLNLALEPSACAASASADPADLKDLPKEYHDFADVFSKSKADTLAPHQPYDLKIQLEDSASPPQPPIYSLSTSELATLREFLDEHLSMGYIRPTRSSHGAPILFVKKKDGSLQLCVDFRALNNVTKTDRYPLPLILDLLDAPRKARLYTKIMSGDNPFSASDSDSGPNSGPYSGDPPSSSELCSASGPLLQLRRQNYLGSEASRLVGGIKVQGCQGQYR